jgi:hypothetical protein
VDAFWLGKDGAITRSFDLAAADSEIEIVAEDKSGNVQSLPAKITVHADPKAIMGVPDLYVLAIGADHYRDTRKSLHFAVKDATALAETLTAAGAEFYRHRPIVKTLFDGDVTAEKIKAAFDELSAKVKATDVFVFYIAGHGRTVDGDFYFLPPSETGFSEEEIKVQGFGPGKLSAWFEQIKAQKSIWIFDTCESGSAERLFRVRDAAAEDAAYRRLKDATGRTIFMASSEQQLALEGYGDHGVFTYALLESLARAGSGDKVLLYDLASYVEDRVPELSRALKACDAKGSKEYCQRPIINLGNTPNYPVAPRYPQVLAMLPPRAGESAIPREPTHVVIEAADIHETLVRGAPPKRQIGAGELVAVVKIEDGYAKIAQKGVLLGYIDQTKLLELKQ